MTLLYEMPSNPKGKKLRLKNPMLFPSEYDGKYLQMVLPLIIINAIVFRGQIQS